MWAGSSAHWWPVRQTIPPIYVHERAWAAPMGENWRGQIAEATGYVTAMARSSWLSGTMEVAASAGAAAQSGSNPLFRLQLGGEHAPSGGGHRQAGQLASSGDEAVMRPSCKRIASICDSWGSGERVLQRRGSLCKQISGSHHGWREHGASLPQERRCPALGRCLGRCLDRPCGRWLLEARRKSQKSRTWEESNEKVSVKRESPHT